MMLSHVVPRNGVAHEHDAQELMCDMFYLGHHESILLYYDEPALRSPQEQLKKIRGESWCWKTLGWEIRSRKGQRRGCRRASESSQVSFPIASWRSSLWVACGDRP